MAEAEKQDGERGWKDLLIRDDRRERRPIRTNIANVCIALNACDELRGIVAYDSFSQQIVRCVATPWNAEVGPWDEVDELRLTEFLQRHDINVSLDTVHQGVHLEAEKRQINPVRDYLAGLTWDGTLRAEKWLVDYLGVADTEYSRAVGRKFLISAVARIFEPASKVDTMLVLEGAQGIGKSTALRLLAGDDWFTDQIPNMSSREASIQIQGKWVIEISELDAMRKAEITEVKAFLSRTSDRYRAPYSRTSKDFPRQCIFAGTTNSDTYLKDPTGNRRFWPIHCTKIDREALIKDRSQLWAEAVVLYQAGEQWHLTEAEDALAISEQNERFSEDAWAHFIDRYVWSKRKVTVTEVLQESEIALLPQNIDQLARTRVTNHLKHWKWEKAKSGSQRYYKRPTQIPEDKHEYVKDMYEQLDWVQTVDLALMPVQRNDQSASYVM